MNPLADDAARFFNGASGSGSSSSVVRAPFDVGALRGTLPAVPAPAAASGWTADFARAAGDCNYALHAIRSTQGARGMRESGRLSLYTLAIELFLFF